MRVKPFLHVELELIFGMLVLEDIGHLPGTLVIRCGGLIELAFQSWSPSYLSYGREPAFHHGGECIPFAFLDMVPFCKILSSCLH